MNKEKFEIELLSRNYLNSKRIIKETEEDIIHTSYERLKAYRRIVSHIENVAEGLGEKERLIIQKEVIEGRSGKWYLEYFSAPSYYRHRRKAYSEFLRCL
ncbi:MAG: hypothetical protein IIZ64_05190 [Erysipelotrichaceae bacterium]|nr:hypothetical protein [Erysipelotrichaceae bacterium]MBQ1534189.1 hypothetical protein [Erysipelotrichaceae bacterium]MBQ2657461.1 hypothetical protein [Erysipelotrichaceae bacterium]